MLERIASVTLMITAVTVAVRAADEPPPTRSAIVDELVDNALRASQHPTIKEPFAGAVDQSAGLLITYLIDVEAERSERKAYRQLLDAMDARWNKQVGSSPSSTGSTSVAVKGLVPEIIGLAVERGAITRDVDGTSVTFRTSPAGLIQALDGRSLADIYRYRSQSAALRVASRVSVSATFDTSRGDASGVLLANGQQLSGWSVRYNAYNGRDPGAAKYAPLWTALSRKSDSYIAAGVEIRKAMGGWAEFNTWQASLVKASQAIDRKYATDRNLESAAAAFRALLEESLPGLAALSQMPAGVATALDAYVAELTKVQNGTDAIYAFAEKGLVATLEWTTTRDPGVPDLYAATGVLDGSVGALRQNDLTLNLGLNFYRSAPESTGRRFKSFAAAGEYAHLLGKVRDLPFTLSVSARYEYLPDDVAVTPVADGSASLSGMPAAIAPKGNIVVGQAKLIFPLAKGTGIKVPIALTVSNRTELIKEKEVRVNFGFTVDLDSVMAAWAR